jgi:Tfp pilus assembly protein PilN
MPSAINVNLASQPFRRDRPLILAGVIGGLVLGAMLAFQLSMIYFNRQSTIEARAEVATLNERAAAMAQEQARLEAALRQPANARALEESVFFNSLLRRKGISWARIFADVEGVLPGSVRLVSVRPAVNQFNQIELQMAIASSAPQPAIDMVQRLESSPQFGATSVETWLPPSNTDPTYRYTLRANYATRF